MISEQPRKILCEIINRHGIGLCDDVDYCETLLYENCGDQYKREVFILTNALHENVVADLLNPSPNLKLTALLSHLTQRLHNNLGFDKALAEWAVQSWAVALNKITEVPKKPANKTDEVEFTQEFSQAFELMEKNHPCVFITGKAGTGKSTLLDYFKRNTQKKIAVLAPTGVAALNVGGVTLHSFFRLAPRPIHPDELKPVRAKKRRKLYQSFDIIVIDEVSMVRADMMDVIDRFMRLNGRHPKQPFGGVQMIFIGDLFQLPPVVSSDEETKLFMTTYESPFFFSAKVFDELEMAFVELTKVYRQKEQIFLDLLNTIRNNQANSTDIEAINQRYQPQFEADIHEYYITLTTTNQLAAQINTVHLEKLSTRLHQFEGEINGKFEQSTLPTELVLSLKEGAQVMFVKNDSDGRWVNGTLGRIKKIKRDEIQVETSTKQIFMVKKVKWEILTYQFDEKTQAVSADIIGSFTQYPLKLAWAITIHKSQGKQFDRVIIDLGWGAFAHGQLYVALSRCKTLDGLILKKPVRSKDVIVDNRVIDFCLKLTQPQTSDPQPSSMPPPF